jgi:hypothetical protein
MANTLLTPSVIAREALMLLESNMVFGNLVFRGHQTEFTGAKAGDTIQVRGPATFAADRTPRNRAYLSPWRSTSTSPSR